MNSSTTHLLALSLVLLAATAAQAQAPASLVGTWSTAVNGMPFELELQADGTFIYGSESGGSGRLTNQYGDVTASYGAVGAQSRDGRWSATGNQQNGTLTLQYSDGSVVQVPYVVSQNPADRSGWGPAVSFDGILFQRTGDGVCR